MHVHLVSLGNLKLRQPQLPRSASDNMPILSIIDLQGPQACRSIAFPPPCPGAIIVRGSEPINRSSK